MIEDQDKVDDVSIFRGVTSLSLNTSDCPVCGPQLSVSSRRHEALNSGHIFRF